MDSSTSKVTLGDEKMPGYTISLDKIDLSLIPIFNHQRRDTKVPLWSPAASAPGAEYYELQVLAEEGSSKDERLENASTHMCHVCNVDVCISYWHRHSTSAVHQANKAIAQTSLCRMQQMALSTAVTPPAPRTTTYFCRPCSSAVALSKRTAHKQSEQHSSAVLYEQLLQSLARLYESKDNLVIVCEDVSRAICDHATISKDLKSRLLDKKLHKKEENKDNEINNKSETDADHIKPTESNVTKTQAQLVKTDQSQIGYPIGTTIKPMPKLMLQKPTKKLHYLFSRTKDLGPEVMCLVCQTNLSLCDVMSHRKSKTHQEVYIDFLTTNTIFRIPGRRYFCNCCRQTIHVRMEYAHIISERHRCNLNRNTERLDQAALMKLSIATLKRKIR